MSLKPVRCSNKSLKVSSLRDLPVIALVSKLIREGTPKGCKINLKVE